MKSSTKLAVANGLMGLGMAPMMLWVAMLVNALDHRHTGDLALPELMFAGVVGMGAYLFTLFVAGAGAVWAGGLLRGAPDRARRIAKVLIAITAGVLIMPWGGVLALVVARLFD